MEWLAILWVYTGVLGYWMEVAFVKSILEDTEKDKRAFKILCMLNIWMPLAGPGAFFHVNEKFAKVARETARAKLNGK